MRGVIFCTRKERLERLPDIVETLSYRLCVQGVHLALSKVEGPGRREKSSIEVLGSCDDSCRLPVVPEVDPKVAELVDLFHRTGSRGSALEENTGPLSAGFSLTMMVNKS